MLFQIIAFLKGYFTYQNLPFSLLSPPKHPKKGESLGVFNV